MNEWSISLLPKFENLLTIFVYFPVDGPKKITFSFIKASGDSLWIIISESILLIFVIVLLLSLFSNFLSILLKSICLKGILSWLFKSFLLFELIDCCEEDSKGFVCPFNFDSFGFDKKSDGRFKISV